METDEEPSTPGAQDPDPDGDRDRDRDGAGDLGERFRESAAALGVTVTRVDPDGVAAAVAAAVEPPVVAAGRAALGAALESVTVPAEPTRAALEAATTGVTPAAVGVAESGSVVLVPDGTGVEPVSLYPQRHVAVLETGALVPDLAAALAELGPTLADGGDAILATGPSATADMGDLVVGAHGPATVHVVLVEEQG